MDSRLRSLLAAAAILGLGAACGERAPDRGSRGAAALLHLADRLAEATVSSARPSAALQERAWRFDAPRPEWRALSAEQSPQLARVGLEQLQDGLKLSLSAPPVPRGPLLVGGLAVDLEGLLLADWDTVLVKARSRERLAGITVAYNLEDQGSLPHVMRFLSSADEAPPVFCDGSEQVYAIPLRPREEQQEPAALRSLGVLVGAPGPASLDILSIVLVPRGASFREDCGVRSVVRDGVTRLTLYAHAPASLAYRVEVPAGGRLDVGLATGGEAVTFRVVVRAGGGEPRVLLEETLGDSPAWQQRSVDLSRHEGTQVELALEAASGRPGAVALWGAPVLSGSGRPERPNVLFYVIDGGGADLMSVYGYNRRTTPFLEELAKEGVVFERAFSNATWTQPSTASFMTSLQHSVLGGLRRGVHSTPVPPGAVTMAEHMRRGGYQTAVFTSNPNAARLIGLERGVDVMRDVETGHHSTSSSDLHELFWRFRGEYPGRPFWVHFQTTDVHEPNEPTPPFAGLFVRPQERAELEAMEGKLWQAAAAEFGTTSIAGWYDLALERSGVDRQAYFNIRRGLYDETMAYQDRQLQRFVARLKAEGEWENTILIVTADHGHPAGTFARFGRGLFDPQPEPWQGALFDSYATRVPLIVSWPARIAGGRRFAEPVSLIDVLPTILDLAGLPQPEVLQGQSLAPLLLGLGMQVRPAILDEFRFDEASGGMIGNLDVVDGRWGASLEIGPLAEGSEPERGRHAVPAGGRWGARHPFFPDAPRLLLYDLLNDPFALRAVNDEHPELVERYRRLLLAQWRDHRALAQRFGEAGEVALTPEQLQQLRSLGYIK